MANTAFVLNGQIGLTNYREQLVAAGKSFCVTNPTIGTGIQYGLQTSFSATANGLFLIQNTNPATSGINIVVDYLSLIMTGTAPTATTSMRIDAFNETGIVTMSGSFAAKTPVNLNPAFSNATGAVVQSYAAGAATIPAAVGVRRTYSPMTIPTSLGITGDNYVVDFGGDPAPTAPLTAVRATAATRLVTQGPSIIVAPQTTTWFNLWWLTAATTAPTFEFDLVYYEL